MTDMTNRPDTAAPVGDTGAADPDDGTDPGTGPTAARGDLAGAVAGVLAAGAGLATASFAAAVADVDGPVVAVGNRVVDAAPRWLKNWAIDTFGTADKPVLLGGVWVVLGVAAVVAGRAAFRGRRRAALAGVALAGVLGVVAAVTRTGSRGADWLPPALGTFVAGVLLWAMARSWTRGNGAGAPADDPLAGPVESPLTHQRRRFLVQAGLAGVGAAALGGIARGARRADEQRVAVAAGQRTLPAPRSAAPPVPAGATADGGLEPYLTPNASFYRIDTALATPVVDPDTWKLTIGGMVERPFEIGYDELLARPMVERVVTLACVSNDVGGDLVGNARWLGVPLADLLHDARVRPGATQVATESVDGWTCGFPTAIALDGRDALVAVGMNGEPLPRDHGYPARLVVPGLYGYVSATKWLRKLTLTTWEDFDGYWVPRGWSKEGPVKTQSRIDVPRAGRPLPAGRAVVAGVAWAQHRGIARVEVQVDDGPWADATLADQPTVDGWRQWRYEWAATPGRHRLRVRATDATGALQPEGYTDVAPNGAEGWHRRTVEVTA
jgi:DMSO/TMAO reductase YedYZ molybdopterin-dependent catalytic subunit